MNYNEKLFKDLLACDWLSNCGHGDIAYNLGINVSGNHQSERFLVMERDEPLIIREVPQEAGIRH